MSSFDVSVVIPAHNAERFICEAIDSVLMQTGFSIQVIVIDNASSDRTSTVVAQCYGGSVTLASESQLGIGPARNTGVRLATGKHLAFLDADDIWMPGSLHLRMRHLNPSAGVHLVFGHCQEFHDSILSPEQRLQWPCRPEPYPLFAADTCVLERSLFDEIGDFPHVRAGEFVSWYGTAKALGFGDFMVPEICVRRRSHLHNTSAGQSSLNDFPAALKLLIDRRRQVQAAAKVSRRLNPVEQ
jgi:glycosyltransferase involved in cell wall biosynthesis